MFTVSLCRELAAGIPHLLRAGRFLVSAFFLFSLAHAVDVPPPGKAFDLNLQKDDLDLPVFAEWENGEETALKDPAQIVWTHNSTPSYRTLTYGLSSRLGPRRLRVGFTKSISAGTVIVSGGGRLSVLKPGAAYPGRLDQESDWVPAQRLVDGKISTAEVPAHHFATWVLPPQTTTRALRFTHVPLPTDRSYGETIDALCLLPERFLNVAPLALAQAHSDNVNAVKINDEKANFWKPWSNMPETKALKGVPLVTPENPEWVLLDWKKPVALRGLISIFTGFGSADIQVYTGPESIPARDAGESAWKTLGEYQGLQSGWPTFWPNWLPFTTDITVRAVRLRMTSATKGGNPNLQGKMNDGRRVWVEELMALTPLGNKSLADLVAAVVPPPAPATKQLHPPIPIKFTLTEPGYVTR